MRRAPGRFRQALLTVRGTGTLALAEAVRASAWMVVCALAWFAWMLPDARAQALRDPTMPPASAVGTPHADASGRPAAPDTGPVAVIVRNGQPFLVVGTRLYAQGQMLGGARIERITETEVWLREGKTLHKKPTFAGIVRSVAGATSSPPDCVLPARKAPAPRRPTPAPAGGKKADLPTPGEPCKP